MPGPLSIRRSDAPQSEGSQSWVQLGLQAYCDPGSLVTVCAYYVDSATELTMFGLVVLLIMFGYLAVAVTATLLAARSVKKAGGSRRDQWKRGGLVALIFYLIPFWDAIPTWVVYSYMCHTAAGIVVRKDMEKWKSDNKLSLPAIQRTSEAERFIRIDGVSRYQMNTRIAVDHFPFESIFLSIRKVRSYIFDTENGEILVTKQDFVSGSRFGSDRPEGMKIWLRKESCTEGVGGIQSKFSEILANYERIIR